MAKMGKIIRNGIEYTGGGGSASNIEYLTQEAYDALPESKLTNGVEYRITDANTSTTAARNIAYDNSESGIEATSVQGAIDKLAGGNAGGSWELLGTCTRTQSSTAIDFVLPLDDYNEFMFVITTDMMSFSSVFLSTYLKMNSNAIVVGGYYLNANTCGGAWLNRTDSETLYQLIIALNGSQKEGSVYILAR